MLNKKEGRFLLKLPVTAGLDYDTSIYPYRKRMNGRIRTSDLEAIRTLPLSYASPYLLNHEILNENYSLMLLKSCVNRLCVRKL